MIQTESRARHYRSMLLFLTSLALALLLLLRLRFGDSRLVANSLWAEDGPIFLQRAIEAPLASLAEPYAGYLHLYPRLIAAMATRLPLETWPQLMFAGWLGALLLVGWACWRALGQQRHGALIAAVLTLACLGQPHSGETFLTITNAQWWLAVALALMLAVPEAFGRASAATAGLLALTGPFSVLYLPLAWYQARKLERYHIAIAMSAGALVQMLVMLSNPRSAVPWNGNLADWLTSLTAFVVFGGKPGLDYGLAALFWGASVYLFFRAGGNLRVLVLCGMAVYAASMYSMREMPQVMSPTGPAARYYVVSYATLVMASWFGFKQCKAAGAIALCSLGAVFVAQFTTLEREEQSFRAYAQLHKYEHHLTIPILPRWEDQPPFRVVLHNPAPLPVTDSALLEPAGKDSYLVARNACKGARVLAFVIEIERETAGVAMLAARDGDGTPVAKTRRYYPAGQQRMQFGLIKGAPASDIVFTAQEKPGKVRLGSSYVVCK